MTTREREISKAILAALHDQDRGQLSETQLHCTVNLKLQDAGRVAVTLGEFNGALNLCDKQGLVTGVAARFGGRKWNISDAGEAALSEM
jgi:hypothetical protein